MKKKIGIVMLVSFALTGCNTLGENGSSMNMGEVFQDFMNFTTTKNNGGVYTAKSDGKTAVEEKTIQANVDVDTAAARLKRKYGFRSEQEVSQLNNGSTFGAYKEAAARTKNYVWSATPGSSYKMGQDMSDKVAVQLEIVKNGANKSTIYATFKFVPGSLDVVKSIAQIKAGAEGR